MLRYKEHMHKLYNINTLYVPSTFNTCPTSIIHRFGQIDVVSQKRWNVGFVNSVVRYCYGSWHCCRRCWFAPSFWRSHFYFHPFVLETLQIPERSGIVCGCYQRKRLNWMNCWKFGRIIYLFDFLYPARCDTNKILGQMVSRSRRTHGISICLESFPMQR